MTSAIITIVFRGRVGQSAPELLLRVCVCCVGCPAVIGRWRLCQSPDLGGDDAAGYVIQCRGGFFFGCYGRGRRRARRARRDCQMPKIMADAAPSQARQTSQTSQNEPDKLELATTVASGSPFPRSLLWHPPLSSPPRRLAPMLTTRRLFFGYAPYRFGPAAASLPPRPGE